MRDPVALVSCVACPAVKSAAVFSTLSRGRKPLGEMCSLGSTDLTNIIKSVYLIWKD